MFSDNLSLCNAKKTIFTKHLYCCENMCYNDVLNYVNVHYKEIKFPFVINVYDVGDCSYFIYRVNMFVVNSQKTSEYFLFDIFHDINVCLDTLEYDDMTKIFEYKEFIPMCIYLKNNRYKIERYNFDVIAYDKNMSADNVLNVIESRFSFEIKKFWKIKEQIELYTKLEKLKQ